MPARVACNPKSAVARRIGGVQNAEIVLGSLDMADVAIITKADMSGKDKSWVEAVLKTDLPILAPANLEFPSNGHLVIPPCYDLDEVEGMRKAIKKAQSDAFITKNGRFVWPKLPRHACMNVAVKVDGGMGDMTVAFPSLRELKKKGYKLYIQRNQADKCKAILLRCPDVIGELPDSLEHQDLIITYHTHYAPSGDAIRCRQDQYADSCSVDLHDDYHAEFKLDEGIRKRYLDWKRGLNRPVVALGLFATTKMKSMEPDRAKRITEILSENFHVAVIHWEHTIGSSKNITDWGGKLSTDEMIHLVSVMDGALCIDSGIAHIAAAQKIPLFALQGVCGVGNHIRYGLYGGKVEERCLNLKCCPCWPEFTCQFKKEDHYADCLKFDPVQIAAAFRDFMGNVEISAKPQAKRTAVVFGASGGFGDRIAMLPALQAMEGNSFKLDDSMDEPGKSLFGMSPLFNPNLDRVSGELRLRPCDPVKDSPEDRALPIQDWHAKCAGVKIKDYRVNLRLDEQLLRQYQAWVYSHKRPVIGLALNSAFGVQSRTMPEAFQKRLIDALGQKYHVALIHSGKTSGDATNVTDWGGKLSQREMLHLIAALDGMVAVDSGPAHAACVTGTPLVALMGIVRLEKRYAKYDGNAVRGLNLDLDCSPCWEKGSYGCEKPPKCLEFTPDDVLPALQDVCGYVASPEPPYWDWSVVCRYDRPFTEVDTKAYMADLAEIHKFKYYLVKSLPKSPVKKMCEIGVRAGNGARDMKMAWPSAFYHGFDAENGQAGGGPQVLTAYARTLLERFWPGTSEITAPFDSQAVSELPGGPYDFIHVDGGHESLEVQHDLTLALKALAPGGIILVDDITYIPSVKAGVGTWLLDHVKEVEYSFHETKRGDIAIWRKTRKRK